jgi:hypothetical protein
LGGINYETKQVSGKMDEWLNLEYILSEGRAAAGLKAGFGLIALIAGQFTNKPVQPLLRIFGGALILFALIEISAVNSKYKRGMINLSYLDPKNKKSSEKKVSNSNAFFTNNNITSQSTIIVAKPLLLGIKLGFGLAVGFFLAGVIISLIITVLFGISIFSLFHFL